MRFDKNYLFITLLGAAFFLPFLGNAHLFDWDEINFAECAREMILTGDYLSPRINFEPFWEKPPLFIWLQVLSMQAFGVNEFAARLPNALIGILTLLSVYHIGKKLYDATFGWLWVAAYCGAILPHLFHKSGIIDPTFNLFIFLSLNFLIEAERQNAEKQTPQYSDLKFSNSQILNYSLILGGLFSGLAILTKGPVGYLIVALTWLLKTLIYRDLSWKRVKRFAIFSAVAGATAAIWFGAGIVQNGFWFITEFWNYNIRLAKTQDAGHGGFLGYHFVVLLIGCFPSSLFALSAIWWRYNFLGEKTDFTRWMKTLFWVVLILFSIINTKIVHYSSMCYLPLSFLAAITFHRWYVETFTVPNYIKWFVGIVGGVIGLAAAALPFLGENTDLLKPYFNDPFAVKNLDAVVIWSGIEVFIGVFLIISVLIFPFILKNKTNLHKSDIRHPTSDIRILRGVFFLFLATVLFLQMTLYFFVPKIEAYSQRAAIDFYQSKRAENCYIGTFGYKSYAHIFYSDLKPPTAKEHDNLDWLLNGKVDKSTYIVGKVVSKDDLDKAGTLTFLYERNGFVFYKRNR